MKIKELIEVLNTLNPEAEVIMGNGSCDEYSPLCSIDPGMYAPENSYSGCFIAMDYFEEFLEENLEYDMDEDEYQEAVCFYPIN